MSLLPMPTPVKWCEWCGATVIRKRWASGRWESPQSYEKRRYCSRRCNVDSGAASEGGVTRAETAKRDDNGRYIQYEPKPSWVECTHCGARRPPASLKDGRCAAWEVLHLAEVNGELSEYRENRCDELAKSREAK